jgi:hypothetical protein
MEFDMSILNNNYVTAIIAIVIAVYASMIRVQVPPYIAKLFKSNIFRVVFLSLLLICKFNNSPHVAIAVAVTFVMTMHYLTNQEIRDKFKNISQSKLINNQ